jgi:hypothetical protein
MIPAQFGCAGDGRAESEWDKLQAAPLPRLGVPAACFLRLSAESPAAWEDYCMTRKVT